MRQNWSYGYAFFCIFKQYSLQVFQAYCILGGLVSLFHVYLWFPFRVKIHWCGFIHTVYILWIIDIVIRWCDFLLFSSLLSYSKNFIKKEIPQLLFIPFTFPLTRRLSFQLFLHMVNKSFTQTVWSSGNKIHCIYRLIKRTKRGDDDYRSCCIHQVL